MILFGGCSKKERFADVFSFDANGDGSFTQVLAEGTAPFPRSSHAAVYTENQIFYFGGYGGEGKSRVFMNDMFSLSFADGNATWVHHAHKGTAPKPRCSHSMTPIANGKMLIVVGGRVSSKHHWPRQPSVQLKLTSPCPLNPRRQGGKFGAEVVDEGLFANIERVG